MTTVNAFDNRKLSEVTRFPKFTLQTAIKSTSLRPLGFIQHGFVCNAFKRRDWRLAALVTC